jgi:hypothetical protein
VGPLDDTATELGLNVTCGPAEESLEVKDTVPEKPLRLERVIVEVPDDPWTILRAAGLADMLKSGPRTITVSEAGWDKDPLIPVAVIVYVPTGVDVVVEIARVEVPVPPAIRGTGFGLNENVRPVTGAVVDAARFTFPAKLFKLVSVMVEVAELPPTKLAGVAALAEMLKSGTAGD